MWYVHEIFRHFTTPPFMTLSLRIKNGGRIFQTIALNVQNNFVAWVNDYSTRIRSATIRGWLAMHKADIVVYSCCSKLQNDVPKINIFCLMYLATEMLHFCWEAVALSKHHLCLQDDDFLHKCKYSFPENLWLFAPWLDIFLGAIRMLLEQYVVTVLCQER